jgi:Lrp/AsnC family leucine-responsive transcriptional regulator
MEAKRFLDAVDRRLVAALQRDARISFAELGRLVGLSPPAAAERVRRLEEQGVVRGYHAEVDRTRLGWGLSAFVRLRCANDALARVVAFARERPEVLECHRVAGEEAFVLLIAAPSVAELDQVLIRLAELGTTTSSLILSSPVASKPIEGVDA